ncbi:MAG: hypothetical protein AB7J35_03775 [Dehalococcoidia bacterium]
MRKQQQKMLEIDELIEVTLRTDRFGDVSFRLISTLGDLLFLEELAANQDLADKAFVLKTLEHQLLEPANAELALLEDGTLLELTRAVLSASASKGAGFDSYESLRTFEDCRAGASRFSSEQLARFSDVFKPALLSLSASIKNVFDGFSQTVARGMPKVSVPNGWFEGLVASGSPWPLALQLTTTPRPLDPKTGPGPSVVDLPTVTATGTPWDRVHRQVVAAQQRLADASAEEDFQTVGLLCREVMISLAQAAHDPAKHPPLDDVIPSNTDAKRRIDAYLEVELGGASAEQLRKSVHRVLDHAVALQHNRNADLVSATMCLTFTVAAVRSVELVARAPGDQDSRLIERILTTGSNRLDQ